MSECTSVKSCEGNFIDVIVEGVGHAAEVGAKGNKATDVVLVVESFFGCR